MADPLLLPRQEPDLEPGLAAPLDLRSYARMSPLQVLRHLQSSLRGLEESQAEARLLRCGDNVVLPVPRRGWWVRLVRVLGTPFIVILIVLAGVSGLTGDLPGLAVVGAMVLTSCVLQVSQEYRADRAAAALRAMVATTATTLRRYGPGAAPVAREVPTDQLVPGDVVHLAVGDLVPADLRLLRTEDLMIGQALLTGESLPVPKQASLAGTTNGSGDSVFDCPSLCLLGSSVVSGTATAVVVATGTDTYFGATHRDLPRSRGETSFDRGVRAVARRLVRFILAAVLVVLAVNGLSRGDWLEALLVAVSVAVGLTPEMLPVVVTTALRRGAVLMGRGGVLVKRLPAIHDLGAMDVLCTDKTGTLTQGAPSVAVHLAPDGRSDPSVLGWAALNAQVSAEHTGFTAGDPLDEALIEGAAGRGCAMDAQYRGLGALAFDSGRRRASVLVRPDGRWGRDLLITKGAVEDVLACCSAVRGADGDQPLTQARRAALERVADGLHGDGLRVLAVAVRAHSGAGRGPRVSDERGMALVGFVGLADEASAEAGPALAVLAGQGVAVKVITGDHPLVAARVCRAAGLEPGQPVHGRDLYGLDDAALAELAAGTTVFARVDPMQKARIVRALRANGSTVGFLGDGMNDAPALRAADVGICVEQAVAVARESADILLVRKDLAALSGAVAAGRRAFLNIIKYLKITVSANVGNVCSMVAASVLLPFLPMLPLQILVQNLLFDVSQLCLAFDRTDRGAERAPRTFDVADLTRFVVCFGAINSLADLATFAALWHALGHPEGPGAQVLFHTAWFVENLLTQAVAVHLLRSRMGPWRRGALAARPVLAATVAIVLAAVAAPVAPVSTLLGFHGLPNGYYLWFLALLLGFCAVTLTAKAMYRRTFARWL